MIDMITYRKPDAIKCDCERHVEPSGAIGDRQYNSPQYNPPRTDVRGKHTCPEAPSSSFKESGIYDRDGRINTYA